MQSFILLTVEKYYYLTEDEIEYIDQYFYPFAKLQDAIGQRLFRYLLLYLGKEIENRSFVDIYHKLGKLKIDKDYSKWVRLRVVRNELSHEYEIDPDQNSGEINNIFKLKDILVLNFTDINHN